MSCNCTAFADAFVAADADRLVALLSHYLTDPPEPAAHGHSLIVLTLAGGKICAITRFGDSSLFPGFGLPPTLPR